MAVSDFLHEKTAPIRHKISKEQRKENEERKMFSWYRSFGEKMNEYSYLRIKFQTLTVLKIQSLTSRIMVKVPAVTN